MNLLQMWKRKFIHEIYLEEINLILSFVIKNVVICNITFTLFYSISIILNDLAESFHTIIISLNMIKAMKNIKFIGNEDTMKL